MESVVHAQSLARRYGPRWALSRIDLEIGPRERLLVVGPNGSGKTTLIRLLTTLEGPTGRQRKRMRHVVVDR